MQRSAATFLMLAAVLAAGVAVVWSSFAGEPPAPPPPGPQPPNVAGPADATPEDHGAPAKPHVRVEVQLREAFVPPPPVRVEAVGSDGAPLSVTLVAGEGAGFAAAPPKPGLALAAIALGGGRWLLRQVAVGDAGVARITVGAPIVVTGRVQDEAGAPIAGASVWAGESDGEGNRREAVTGDDGAFETDTPGGAGVPLVVRAAGRASSWQAVMVSPSSREFPIAMRAAAGLDVQFAAAADLVRDLRLFVVPRGPISTELASYPFFLQTLADGFVVASNGSATVPDLPRGATVGLVVSHPRVIGAAPHAVTLRAANERVVLPLRTAEAVWQGRVVDEAGAPLAGVSVWSRPPRQQLDGIAAGRFLPPHLGAPGCFAAHTDDDGAFTIGAVEPGGVLSLRAADRAGRDLAWPPADASAPVVLPSWSSGPQEFRLQPPQAATPWLAECDLAGGIRAEVAADQPWIVSFPQAGFYRVVTTTFVGGREVGKAERDVAVTGPVDLQAPRVD